jgi:hypothetical protein
MARPARSTRPADAPLEGRTLDDLLALSPEHLAALYASASVPQLDQRGEGINRVLLDRFRLYRFETFVGRSRAGDFDAVQLDYDRPSNPFFIRPIRDEIRELSPGLYLGQAWLEIGSRPPALVLYFGLTAGG